MQLAFKQYGEVGPALIMLHGLFGSQENLAGIARYLSQHYTVYSLDMRNHGRSPHADSMALADMACDVVEFMDAQGIDQSYLLGHSLGGKVMMELALAYPNRAIKVVVGDIAPVDYGTPRHNDVFAGLEGLDLSAIGKRSDADPVMAEYIKELPVRSFILKNLYRDGEGKYHWRINVPALKNNYPLLIGANRRDRQYSGPLLFLKGELSDYLTESHRAEVSARFSSPQVKTLAGTGHWLHAEKPEIFAKLTHDFLSA